jgi:hypothetical protein
LVPDGPGIIFDGLSEDDGKEVTAGVEIVAPGTFGSAIPEVSVLVFWIIGSEAAAGVTACHAVPVSLAQPATERQTQTAMKVNLKDLKVSITLNP